MQLTVNLTDRVSGTLARTMARLRAAAELHETMGAAVEDRVAEHLRATKQSPNTGWWGRAIRSLSHTSSATEAVVSFSHRGVALRYYGGTVRQRPGGPLLTIPSEHVPVSHGTRRAAREMGQLAFLRARRPARKGVVGVLVEGEGFVPKRGKYKGQQRVRPKQGGKLLYTLMTEVDHQADSTVLPTTDDLLATASEAAADYLATTE